MSFYRGISLIELMIVLIVIGILSMTTIPIYTHQIARVKRFETEILLNKIAAALEKYNTLHDTYEGATLTSLGFANKTSDNRYDISLKSTDSHFLLVAIASDKQAIYDEDCSKLTLNDLQDKETPVCWG